MKIIITKADKNHLQDCKIALQNSTLGNEYFPSDEKTISTLSEALTKEEIFVAINENGACLGFIWFIVAGAFHSFPYLHIIAIKQEYRRQGIGKQLLAFFEDIVFPHSSKVFLVVADFNPEAKKLYESLGYQQVGELPGLYKEGVTEYLMMKER